ncbi:MAG: glycerol-3-phosphate dehydrogenase/oxidase [Kiritimatiellia bacterium]
MQRDLQRLANESFDLCILGGGINGLATALDATQRGLKVALVEMGDFGGETSAGSLKILHGGLRYLQHLDFSRMAESVRERNALMRMAPHLVDPLGFLVPTTPGLMTGKAAMRVALMVNDVVSWKRNRGVSDPKLHLPAGRIVSVDELKERVPSLPMRGVTGAALFYDAHMRNSDRFTLAFALSAVKGGAALANRVRGVEFVMSGSKIEALKVRDVESDREFGIRAKQFAAMTGPWRDLLPELFPGRQSKREVVKNAGVQLVTRRGVCADTGLAIPGGEPDPEAHLQRGGRHYFSTPWQGHMLWGTRDSEYRGAPEEWRIRDGDIEEFISEINRGLPGFNLKREDVTMAFGGLRMVNAENLKSGSKVARRYAIMDHQTDLRVSNLISMDGIKYTACRIMAEKATDRVLEKLAVPPAACRTAESVLEGGVFGIREELQAEIRAGVPADWPDATVTLLAESYGACWQAVVESDESAGRLLPDGKTPECMVIHALQHEMALHLEDVVLRRTPLGTQGEPSAEVLNRVVEIMTEALSWSAATGAFEKANLLRAYRYD